MRDYAIATVINGMKYLFWSAMSLFTIGFVFFRPVPIVAEEHALVTKGEISGIYEGGVNDIVFYIKGYPTRYYINRGLENGLDLEILRSELKGKEVTVKYPKYWTPLDWNNEIKHLSKLETQDTLWYNELK